LKLQLTNFTLDLDTVLWQWCGKENP